MTRRASLLISVLSCFATVGCAVDAASTSQSNPGGGGGSASVRAVALERLKSFSCAPGLVDGGHVLMAKVAETGAEDGNDILLARVPGAALVSARSGLAGASGCAEHATALNEELAGLRAANAAAYDVWLVADVGSRLVSVMAANGRGRAVVLAKPAGSPQVDDMASFLANDMGLRAAGVVPREINGARKYMVHLGGLLHSLSGGGASVEVAQPGAAPLPASSQNPQAQVPASQAPGQQSSGPRVSDSGNCVLTSNGAPSSPGHSSFWVVSSEGARVEFGVQVPANHSWSLKADDRFTLCGGGTSRYTTYTFLGDGRTALPARADRRVTLVVRDSNGVEQPALSKTITVCVGTSCPTITAPEVYPGAPI